MNTQGLRTWIEVDTKKLAHNYKLFRDVLNPKTKIMAVVKSNAYGHSLIDFSRSVEKLGVDWFGVDSIVEALSLRKEKIARPILVLGYTLPERVHEALEEDISLTVSSLETLESWAQLPLEKKIKIHLKVDTGLHRQGLLEDEMQAVIEILTIHKEKFIVEGLFTHFAEAKDPESQEYTKQQIKKFDAWREILQHNNFSPLVHASATGGALLYADAHYDMVRVGAGLYGIWPSLKTRQHLHQKLELLPILSWKTLISEIKKLPQGAGIGYDRTEKLSRDSTIAICPIGYWHGYARSLSSKGEVLVHGMRAKVLGRIAMDMIVIDITDIPDVHVRDEVTLIGEISVEELAEKSGTSTYEFITRLNPLIKRIYT